MIRRRQAIVALMLVAVGSALAAFGVRDIGLRQIDCMTCRRIFALVMRPDDLNAPIAQIRIDGPEAEFALFPAYVGPYVLEHYAGGDGPPPALNRIECDAGLVIVPIDLPASQRTTRSRWGRGVMIATLFVPPSLVGSDVRPRCRAGFAGPAPGTLVVSRMSEL